MIDATRLALGFGCTTVTQHASDAQAIRHLEEALALGITHFDVARSYGEGRAEQILGRFARKHRSQLFIVTKCGFRPSTRASRAGPAAAPARSSLQGVLYPRLRRWARKYVRRPYSPANVRRSLETSLRELATDYVDCLLLHEADVDDANKTALISELEGLRAVGKIRSFGLGSQFAKLRREISGLPGQFTVLQFEHNPLAAEGLASGVQRDRTVFTHSAFRPFAEVSERLLQEPGRCSRFLQATQLDLSAPPVLSGVLLAFSHVLNPSGRVLFSTTSRDHLRANVGFFNEYLSWEPDRKELLARLFDGMSYAESMAK